MAVALNGIELGEVLFDGQGRGESRLEVPAGAIIDGENLLALTARGGPADLSLLDRIGVTAWRAYAADGPSLRASAPGGTDLRIEGFPTGDIRVLDITDPWSPWLLAGGVAAEGSGHSVQVRAAGRIWNLTAVQNFVALRDDSWKQSSCRPATPGNP